MAAEATEIDTGVYWIRNTANGKRYVGSAARAFEKRWALHRSRLRRGVHDNAHLQSAWNKYGEDAFVFEVVERCLSEECLAREQYWMDLCGVTDPRVGYNIHPTAGSPLGCKLSKEHKANLSAAQRRSYASGKRLPTKHGAESRAKIAAANRARSPESRERHAALLRGRKQSAETKAKRAASLRAAYASGRRKPVVFGAEARDKMGWMRGKKLAPEHLAKRIGRKVSDETKAKMSAVHKARWAKLKEVSNGC